VRHATTGRATLSPVASLTPEQIRDLALAHQAARATATPFRAPTFEHPGMDLDDAYAVQRAWVDLDVAAGRTIVGHKIGLTSQAMQQQMQIDRPDFGALLDDMVIEDGASLEAARFVDPRIEVEFAFVLGSDLAGERVSMLDVLRATDYVVPALELIDARSYRVDPETKKARTVRDTIADNAADAGVVLGGRPMRVDAVDWRWAGAILSRNAVSEETGLGAGVMNHPANGIAWLARTLTGLGIPLLAGHVVLAGSFTRAVMARPGDTFVADYGPLGTVSLHFH
jgi:2-oxo-hept-3-ene-1,7-dioate hydratase